MEAESLEKKLKQKARVRRQEKKRLNAKSATLSRQIARFSSPKKKVGAKVKIILK